MRYLGHEETFDAASQDVIGERIFEYNIKHDDYLFTYHVGWDIVLAEYVFDVGGYRYTLPSGIYIFSGCPSGAHDWIRVDEIIDRDIDIFQAPIDLNSWTIEKQKLMDVTTEKIYMPQTKNPLPVVDSSGKRCIFISYTDVYTRMKDRDFSSMFVL